eukprot:g6469.t1
MSASRDSFGCAIVNNTLLAVGGESGDAPFTLSSVESIDLAAAGSSAGAAWRAGPDLLQARQGHAVTALGGVVYAAGGLAPGAVSTVLASVEAYAPGASSWTALPPMRTARFYHALVALGSALYAIGGLPQGLDADPLASVEAFDFDARVAAGDGPAAAGVWREAVPLPQPRAKMAAAVANGKIYVMGGCPARRSAGAQPCDALLGSV